MHAITQISGLIILLILAVIDVRHRRLPVWSLFVLFIMAVICRFLIHRVALWDVLSGAAAGVLFLLISKITREGFGYADSALILSLGVFLGLQKLFVLLAAAFFLAAVFAGGGLLTGRFSRKQAFPFIPFLAVSYVGILLI